MIEKTKLGIITREITLCLKEQDFCQLEFIAIESDNDYFGTYKASLTLTVMDFVNEHFEVCS